MSETDILSGYLTRAYRLGWDAGRAGRVSRPPFMGEHAQWLWRNGYAAGVASIEATECECSEEYGPCEDHAEVLAQREGASLRTADELLAVFIGDAADIIGRPITEHDASAVADAYWRATGNAGGWVEHDGPDIGIGGEVIGTGAYGPAIRVCSDVIGMEDLAEALHDAATYGAEGALPANVWVWWEDGYVISRITGGPLHPDAAECVWCGRVDRCTDAGTGEATCEGCWHRMDWHRSCDIGDEDTVCPMCGTVLASHVHPEYDR